MRRKGRSFRDPRTVAREIPGVLDILFPRLSGGLVSSLNQRMFAFRGVQTLSDELMHESKLQNAMLFELSVARAEMILRGNQDPGWEQCLEMAAERQRRYYDAQLPDRLEQVDQELASQAADNLIEMLASLRSQREPDELEIRPTVPGLGWIASGEGDFALGQMLIEVKHTDRNFIAADYRQVLMYWLLRYAASVERNASIWTDCILLNPRRNVAVALKFHDLSFSASASLNSVELFELLRSVVGQDLEHR